MRETMKFFAIIIGTCLWASSTALLERGPNESKISGEISTALGITKTPTDADFVTKFTDAGFTDIQRTSLLEKLSPTEMVEFIKNTNLAAYKDQALNIYGNRFGNRRLYILEGNTTEPELLFQNEIAFGTIAAFKDFATVVATKTKSIAMDFHVMSFPAPGQPPDIQQLTDNIKAFNETNIVPNLEQVELHRVFGIEYGLIDPIKFDKVTELSLVDSFLYYYAYVDPNALKRQMSDVKTYDPKVAFPNVVRLAISRTEFSDNNWIKTHYTQLTHLIVDSSSPNYFVDSEIMEALKANTVLTALGVSGCTPNLLRTIGKAGTVPSIKILALKGFSMQFTKYPEVIRMEEIEKFYFEEDKPQKNAKVIQFVKLDEVYWRSPEQADLKLIGFLMNHKDQIKTLTIEKTILSDTDLGKIKGMDKLEEVTFDLGSAKPAITAAAFVQFVKDNTKLSLFRLITTDIAWLTDLNNLMSGTSAGLTDWAEFFPIVQDDSRTIYVKGGKAPNANVDMFGFFKTYF